MGDPAVHSVREISPEEANLFINRIQEFIDTVYNPIVTEIEPDFFEKRENKLILKYLKYFEQKLVPKLGLEQSDHP